ncbi:MAG: hypothetical protein ABSF53_18535 [Terracidiphilus sp.]
MMRFCMRVSILSVVFAYALTLPAQSSGLFEGKWVFNSSESIFSPGRPLPQSETLTFAADGTLTVEGVSGKGTPFLWSFTPEPGKAVQVANRDQQTVETKLSGSTIVHMWRDPSGTEYGEGHIAADGKTMRYVLMGTVWGEHVYEVSVFDRVPQVSMH